MLWLKLGRLANWPADWLVRLAGDTWTQMWKQLRYGQLTLKSVKKFMKHLMGPKMMTANRQIDSNMTI